ncbi:MAG TPA: phage tail sheath C-terminal domain-containing protein [Pseudoneobacillus sp.]|nr:phage tail sheath C-terminal domain-containing protein [Pseudoneobacillus sp.]
MAVSVKTGGVFTKDPGQRPGLYVRFIDRAIAAIAAGSRSKVATVKTVFNGGTAADGKVYRVTNMEQAYGLFGADNCKDIQYLFIGGASEVVVVATSAVDSAGYSGALQKLESYEFHVFVAPPNSAATLDSEIYTWLKTAKTNGLNFVCVFADESAEGVVATTKTKATAFKDEYAVFVGNGVKDAEGTTVDSSLYATYIAGLIAGTALDGSLTYKDVPFAETITRFRTADVKDLLATGIFVTVMDGDAPRIEQGLTLGDTSAKEFNKIRTVRAKQAIIDDISRAVNDNYIGKITNNPDGQIAVINAIKAYLETLANGNVVAHNYTVELDKTQSSTGADLYINVGVQFLDSIEYVYLTITV